MREMEMCFLTSGGPIGLKVLVVFEEIHSHIVEQQLKENKNKIKSFATLVIWETA
jgi:hypothetical protein